MNNIVPLLSGRIICETPYPHLGLHYYGVEYYNLWLKCKDIIFIEKAQLDKMLEYSKPMNHNNTQESDIWIT